jgi:ParB family chromosome partitioning protein
VTQAHKKIVLSSSRDIPFDKLILSQANVRRIKAGVSIEELAEDIARRTLLQSLTVRPVVDADGVETGIYEIPAGGRRYRALDLLVRQKRLARTAPIPCVIRYGGIAEEDSLAENIQRAPLHPLDQFRAFLALREKGQSEEDIAAAFFVSAAVVRQRLRLAAVSPKLLEAYAEDELTLDQLMAFTVNGDHERQEQVLERLTQGYREPYAIRRMLTEGAVRSSDKRVQFIGAETYVEAGGTVLHDLFQGDDGGWLQDVALVERLVADKLEREAQAIVAEGWRWTDVAIDLPYDHAFGLRRLRGEQPDLTEEETAARQALAEQLEALETKYADLEEIPEDVDQRFAEIETAIAAIDERPIVFDPEDVTRAGAFISLDPSGALRIERGFVRPEDEAPIAESESQGDGATESDGGGGVAERAVAEATNQEEPEEDEGIKPIPDRLMTELTTFRTLALRQAVGERPDVAFLAVLHALTLASFYRYAQDTCLEVSAKMVTSSAQAPGLADSEPVTAIAARHQAFEDVLPREPGELWQALATMDDETRHGLFAHCVGLTVNAVHEPWNRRPRALAHADQIAIAVDLDLAPIWSPTVDSYFGRVTKARIVAAVREAKGGDAATRIADLKKVSMAEQAQVLLAGSGWLPEPLRTPGSVTESESKAETRRTADDDANGVEWVANGGDSVVADEPASEDDADVTAIAIAAE